MSHFGKLLLASISAILLAGCASNAPFESSKSASLTGSIHGGQQPVSNASIQLYAVGTGGDGSSATPIFATPALSNANGNFTFPAYSCPSNASLIYLVATGGNPTPTMANPQLALMAAIGPCSTLAGIPFISVNEVTTVAAVYALAPYMTSLSAVGSGTSDATALAAAFNLAAEYASIATGLSPGTGVPSGSTVPNAQIDTIADILAPCINSAGGTFGDTTNCGSLFSLTYPGSGTIPTNAIAALLNLANNPTLNTPTLYPLATPTSPYQPFDATQPSDLSLSLLASPSLLATPSAGLAFGSTTGVLTSSSLTVVLTNTGSTPLSISLGVVGAVSNDFVETSNCLSTLAGAATCTVQVTFTPPAALSYTASLVVSGSAANAPIAIPLTGTGTPGVLSFFPTSLSLATSNVGIPAAAQTTVLTNAGPGTVNLAGFSFANTSAAQFSQTSNCPAQLTAGAFCTVSVSATPTAPGSFSGTLGVSANAGSPVPTVAVSGTGTVIPGIGPLTLSATNFYVPSAGTGVISLTNTGSLPITLSSFVPSTGFSQTNTCLAMLAPYATCNITIAAAATTLTPFNGTLIVNSNASNPSQTVNLVTAKNVYNFGSAVVGYPGATPYADNCFADAMGCGTNATLSGFGFTSSGNCQVHYPSECSFLIEFVPTVVGWNYSTYTEANLARYSDASPVLLVGYGTPPNGQVISYSLSASSINTSYVTGTTPPPATVTLTNTGNQPVVLSAQAANTQGNSSPYSIFFETDTCGGSLAVGASCTISVTVTFSEGNQANLTILSNSNTPDVVVPVTINVVQALPAFTISSYMVTLAPEPIGTLSTPQTLTVTNTGNTPLNFQVLPGSSYPTPFTLSSACTGTVPVAGNCTFTVNGTPQVSGTVSTIFDVFASFNSYSLESTVQLSIAGH